MSRILPLTDYSHTSNVLSQLYWLRTCTNLYDVRLVEGEKFNVVFFLYTHEILAVSFFGPTFYARLNFDFKVFFLII